MTIYGHRLLSVWKMFEKNKILRIFNAPMGLSNFHQGLFKIFKNFPTEIIVPLPQKLSFIVPWMFQNQNQLRKNFTRLCTMFRFTGHLYIKESP